MNRHFFVLLALLILSSHAFSLAATMDFSDGKNEFYPFEVKDLVVTLSLSAGEAIDSFELLVESEKNVLFFDKGFWNKNTILRYNNLVSGKEEKLVKVLLVPDEKNPEYTELITADFTIGPRKTSTLEVKQVAPLVSFNSSIEKLNMNLKEENKLVISMVNLSENSVRDIQILLKFDEETSFNSDYFSFPDLGPKQVLEFDVPFNVSSSTKENKKIEVIVTFVDENGLHELRREVPFVMNGGVFGDSKLLILIGIVIVIILIAWTFLKSRKKQETASEELLEEASEKDGLSEENDEDSTEDEEEENDSEEEK